jgi:hypothetical protein
MEKEHCFIPRETHILDSGSRTKKKDSEFLNGQRRVRNIVVNGRLASSSLSNHQNNVQHGIGKHTWFVQNKVPNHTPFDNFYEGNWENGKREGHGVFQYSSGAIYDGEWVENMKVLLQIAFNDTYIQHGNGIYITQNGNVLKGVFLNDKLIKSEYEGYKSTLILT